MLNAKTGTAYKSPTRKLARFFEKSRDQWKAKHHDLKAQIKYLKNRIRYLEKGQVDSHARAEDLEAEIARLKAEAQALREELEGVKQAHPPAPQVGQDFGVTPYHHAYGVGQVALFLSLVLSAATSLRGAARVMEVVLARFHLEIACPSWHTGRLWLLRVGYYKLTRPQIQAEDWVWIVDFTVQIGIVKCLVILGLRLCDLPPAGQCVTHERVEPLALVPLEHSDGDVVCQQLEKTMAQTGVPREIISDHGTDVKAGIEQFCRQHPTTSAVYDIKHKTAALLKRELEHDPAWLMFTQGASRTQSQVRQTDLAALAPPSQKTKARYMNVDSLVEWGQAILNYLEQPPPASQPMFDPDQVKSKLGWVTEFEDALTAWNNLFQVVTTVESWVRQNGLYPGAHRKLKHLLRGLPQTDQARRVSAELVAFVAQEESQAHTDERLLGSSEIVESVLGKVKRIEHDQAKSGFTGLILSLGALVATTTHDVIQTALESVPTQKVLAWCQAVLGQSVQAKRRAALSPG